MKKFVYPAKLLRSGAAVFLLVITFCLSLVIRPTFAQTAQPPDQNPQPCKYPVQNTDKNAPNYQDYRLTDNFITDSSGDTPIKYTLGPYKGKPSDAPIQITSPKKIPVEIDFSKLQAIFASSTSDYLEGKFQDQGHQQGNLTGMNSRDLNNYYGANQKLIPKTLIDLQKTKYINYVSTHPNLVESAIKITDVGGNNPKTIYDMVSQFQTDPTPPTNQNNGQWSQTWGKYWAKIPTSYNQTYQGLIQFRFTIGTLMYNNMRQGKTCARPFYREFKFNMPDFYRAAATSDQLSQVLIPLGAQADPKHTILGANSSQNFVSQIITICKDLIAQTPTLLKNKIGKIISFSLNLANLTKTVYAATSVCIPIPKDAKNGNASYCPLSQEEMGKPDISCKDNANVVCTFTLDWPTDYPQGKPFPALYQIDPNDPDCTANGDGTYTCNPVLRIFPNFKMPWAARLWNNTTSSDSNAPGVFTIFTPKSIVGEKALPALDKPGKNSESPDIKINNVGGVACNQYFSKDLALKPKALQEALGISPNCGN